MTDNDMNDILDSLHNLETQIDEATKLCDKIIEDLKHDKLI